MQILKHHMCLHHHHQFISKNSRFPVNFKRMVVHHQHHRLFISSCVSKKNDEVVLCKDVEVFSKKDDVLPKQSPKLLLPANMYMMRLWFAVVTPLISILLHHLSPLKPLIKKEEKTNFILVGDLVRFPYNGKHTVGLVSYFEDTKTVIQLVNGEVELHDTDFVRSKVYNITMSGSNETLWGIHLELLCEENCNRENVIKEIKKILNRCKLIKSNFPHLITVASRNPLKISIICHVEREKLKRPYLLRYANLKYDLGKKIGKLGVICE